MYVCTCMFLHVCMYVCMYVCLYVCMHSCVYCIYMCIWVYVCMYLCMYVCMYVFMYNPNQVKNDKCDNEYDQTKPKWSNEGRNHLIDPLLLYKS